MGRREFYAWVDQANREITQEQETPDQFGPSEWRAQAHARLKQRQGGRA